MMRLLLSLCLLLAFIGSLPVAAMPTRPAEPGPTTEAPIPQPQWRLFAPPEGGFSVLLPAPPRSRSVASVSAAGFFYVCKSGDIEYIVQANALSPKTVTDLGAKKVLNVFDDAFLHASPQNLLSRSAVILGGCPGEKIVALRPRGRQERTCAYLVGNRLYRLLAVCPAGDAAAEADADKFLNSFLPTGRDLPDRP